MSSVFFNLAKFKLIIFILLVIIVQTIQAERISLEEDIADNYLDEYSKIEAAFILSGVTHPDSLQKYLIWYGQLLTKIETLPFEFDDPISSAQILFLYLHTTWLKKYALESTTLVDIVHNKEYNCVAATILFNIVCEDLSWTCEAFETPTHVYTIFNTINRKLIVENTSSMGFDIMKNLKTYSKYLKKYYPESDVLRIGLDKLYYHENSKGRNINNTELLGLLAYNRAYFAKKNRDYKAAYEYVLLAQQFNNDSRSNINFEIGLYYAWSKQLFSKKEYRKAFTVSADGYYRYPDVEDFLKNTLLCFNHSMQSNWQKKDWPSSAQLIEEMIALDVFKKYNQNIKQLLIMWMHYFNRPMDKHSFDQVKHYLEMLS